MEPEFVLELKTGKKTIVSTRVSKSIFQVKTRMRIQPDAPHKQEVSRMNKDDFDAAGPQEVPFIDGAADPYSAQPVPLVPGGGLFLSVFPQGGKCSCFSR